MTHRLYYDDAYLRSFEATVLEVRAEDGRMLLRLDRSAFYPTSGGQPFDKGNIGGRAVVDVFADEAGEVWHALAGEGQANEMRPGERVQCQIDWARRFDHMQQHGGEHMLAGEVHRQLGGHTIGLHLGADISTIDVELPGGATHLTGAQIASLERAVNARIQADEPVRCWFPSPEELARLPLRKKPTVAEHVRIVAFGDFEMVACGGTHPSTAGQIAMVKIVDARPSKGKLRIGFLCGDRAVRDYAARFEAGERAAALLSVKAAMLPEAVERLLAASAAQARALSELRRQSALAQVPEMLAAAQTLPGNVLLVAHALGPLTPDALREVATAIIREHRVVALLACERPEGGCQLLFARSEGITWDMGALLKAAAARHGGKGGGRPDFAQGSAADEGALQTARRMLEEVAE